MSTSTSGEPGRDAAKDAERKRRRLQSHSDEAINTEMDGRGLKYRFGWPNLPSLPVKTITEGASLAIANCYKHMGEAKRILEVQNIEGVPEFAYRIPESARQDDWRKYLTFLIAVDTVRYSDDQGMSHLPHLVLRLRHRFKQLPELKNIFIEIIDYRAKAGLLSLPISRGPQENRVLQRWPDILDSTIAALDGMDQEWQIIELLYRGLFEETTKNELTVLITTRTADNLIWWKTTLPELQLRLHPLKLSFTISFEVLYGSDMFCTEIRDNPPNISRDSYGTDVTMGASIGLRGTADHAGTLGGPIKLSDQTRHSLTNWHVVKTEAVNQVIGGSQNHTNFLSPGTATLQRYESPATIDHMKYVDELQKRLAFWQAERSRDFSDQIRVTKQLKLEAENAEKDYGVLFTGSGTRTSEMPWFMTDKSTGRPKTRESFQGSQPEIARWPLDWALVSPLSNRNPIPVLPDDNRAREQFASISKFTRPGILEGKSCTTWTCLNAGDCNIIADSIPVVKYGRTTGYTAGKISMAATAIKPYPGTYNTITESYGYTSTKYASCYSIVSSDPRREFLRAGDSGSVIVHDPSGAWLGLLFGESGGNNGMMIPIDVVFNDIETITGLQVTEPRFTVYEQD